MQKGGNNMGYTLKAARINKNMTQKEAAAALKVSVTTLCSWEKGNSFPDVPNIKKIEGLYGVPYGDLIFCPETSV
jgi:transcriptional regulator with XRE-family HTH domain